MMRKVNLFEMEFWSATDVEAIAENVMTTTEFEDKLPLLITPNVDQIVKLERHENSKLKQFLSRAYWILPDGQPLVSLSKIKYSNSGGLSARLTGSDFFPAIWKRLKQKPDQSVLFIVSLPKLGQALTAERPNSHFIAPPFFDLKKDRDRSEVLKAIVDKVLETKPNFIFVGLGFPKQEVVAMEIFSKTDFNPKVFLLGASFEFYLGTKKRAHIIWQKLGLEFVHRLFSEPRRMFKRYVIDDSAFLRLAITELRRKNK